VPDWYVGRQEEPTGLLDMGYYNEPGAHGNWVDLGTSSSMGEIGNRWGVELTVSTDCSMTTAVGERVRACPLRAGVGCAIYR